MKIILTCLALFILFASSCQKKKDLPVPEITDPHFYVKCDVDGQPLSMEAGNETYYMNSSWYREDAENINVFKANLAKETGSGYQVTILINDYKLSSSGDLMFVDSALSIGEHLFNDQNNVGITHGISFKPVKPFKDNELFSWVVADGINPPRLFPDAVGKSEYSINPIFDVGKTYSVTLNYSDGIGICGQSHMNVFKAGSNVQTTITAERETSSPDLKYKLSYTTLVAGSYSCEWQLPNATTSTSRETYYTSPFGTFPVKLKLTNKLTGEECLSYYQLHATREQQCDANYTASFSKVQNNRFFASVVIILTDANGVVYSSKSLVQPQESDFEIMNVADYDKNEKGQPTKSLKVKFNCIVKNGASEIQLKNGEAKIAIAYK